MRRQRKESDTEDGTMRIIEAEEQKEKRTEQSEQSLTDHQDINSRTHTYLTGVLERGERKGQREHLKK